MNERIQAKINIIKNAIEMNCLTINDWEEEFIDSIEIRISQGKEVTWRQSKVIISIFKRIV